VLEFVIAQFSPAELKAAQRRLVRVFQRDRPMPRGWSMMLATGDSLVTYVTHEIGFHIEQAWEAPWDQDVEAISWTDDLVNGYIDVISLAANHYLGVEKMQELATRAEAAEQWWSAAIRWASVGEILVITSGALVGGPPYRHAVEMVQKAIPTESSVVSACTQLSKDRLELTCLMRILKFFETKDFSFYESRVQELGTSPAGETDPLMMGEMITVTKLFMPMFKSDIEQFIANVEIHVSYLAQAAKDNAGTVLGRRCFISSFMWMCFGIDRVATDWKSQTLASVFGERGCKVTELYVTYSADDHEGTVAQAGADMLLWHPVLPMVLVFYWGEVDQAVLCTQKIIALLDELRTLGSENYTVTALFAVGALPWGLHLIGRNDLAFKWLQDTCGSFENIHDQVLSMAQNWPVVAVRAEIDPEREPGTGAESHYTESIQDCWMTCWMLVVPTESISDPMEYFTQINDPDEMYRVETVYRAGVHYNHMVMAGLTPLLWTGRACERFGLYERGLTYLDKIEQSFVKENIAGAAPMLWYRSLGRSTAGRILARLGRMEEASLRFQGAIDDAREKSYKYLEALAIHEWRKFVLDPAGQGVKAAAPFAAAMDMLGTGRKAQVTDLLARFSGS